MTFFFSRKLQKRPMCFAGYFGIVVAASNFEAGS